MDTSHPAPSQNLPARTPLDAVSLRILGALMEKEITTPDAYPLSLNALLAAANQRSSREPVMDLTEEQVRAALYTLEVASLVVPARGEGRVQRFEHRIRTVLNLRRDETAVLCLLLLRGPQTPGELRSRADRLFPFEDLAQVQATLDRISGRPDPIAAATERAPGSREVRFRHLLGAPQPEPTSAVVHPVERSRSADDAIAALAAIAELHTLVQQLQQRVDSLEQKLKILEHVHASINSSEPHPADE